MPTLRRFASSTTARPDAAPKKQIPSWKKKQREFGMDDEADEPLDSEALDHKVQNELKPGPSGLDLMGIEST